MTIFVVSGIRRSGTSMMMNILLDGGIDILCDDRHVADEYNPKGYFEWHIRQHNMHEPEILKNADGMAVKVIALTILRNGLRALIPEKEYKIIWMERDPKESVKSWYVKKGYSVWVKVPHFKEKIKDFKVKRKTILKWLKKQKNIKVKRIKYKKVIKNPEKQIKKIQKFLDVKLDLEKAINVVDEKLYKIRY